uniref:Uncharacterized protein n=1 Tax=Romanomermis culicivorax TaxID=13658 RepID=A0A915IGM8_ROMCU
MSSIPGSELDEFLVACEKQNIDEAKLMLHNNEALITCKDQSGNCPLHQAVKSNYPMELVRLLSHPAIINEQNINGETPLILAAMYNDAEILRHLIDNGADLNAVDNDGHSALQWSVVNRELTILDCLLAGNASVGIADFCGCRALHYAMTDFDQPSLIIKKLMEHGAEADCADKEGRTPLHWASSCGNVEAFNCLLEYNPHVECLDNCDLTGVHFFHSTSLRRE